MVGKERFLDFANSRARSVRFPAVMLSNDDEHESKAQRDTTSTFSQFQSAAPPALKFLVLSHTRAELSEPTDVLFVRPENFACKL